jgi:hypothetical protein
MQRYARKHMLDICLYAVEYTANLVKNRVRIFAVSHLTVNYFCQQFLPTFI